MAFTKKGRYRAAPAGINSGSTLRKMGKRPRKAKAKTFRKE